jgi:hypothetical protein
MAISERDEDGLHVTTCDVWRDFVDEVREEGTGPRRGNYTLYRGVSAQRG